MRYLYSKYYVIYCTAVQYCTVHYTILYVLYRYVLPRYSIPSAIGMTAVSVCGIPVPMIVQHHTASCEQEGATNKGEDVSFQHAPWQTQWHC